jgi:HK97 family phage major capsid protein
MGFPALVEAEEKLAAKQKQIADVFTEAGPNYDMSQVKSLTGDTEDKVKTIREWNAEAIKQADEVKRLRDLFNIAERNRGDNTAKGQAGREPGSENGKPGHVQGNTKSLGELFVGSQAFKGKKGPIGPEAQLDIELKSLFSTTTGWTPETNRTGRIVEYATRPVQVTDLIPKTTTGQAAVVYMEETTFVNNAAETAEGAQYPEAALALTEQSSPVRKIAVWLPVTDEQLEDVSQVQGYVDNRLRFMLAQRLDGQILTGTGTSPNLRGILNVSGIQAQAKGADPTPDSVYKAMVKVRVTGRAVPDSVVFHPTDWQAVRLLRTADGIYIWGSPSEMVPDRIWGLPVALSDAITLGTAAVFDSTYTELATRRGIDVQISNSHAGFFVEGRQAIRADTRVAFIVYRPTAVCTVTGL